MKIILGIKIIWSNNKLLPKAENIDLVTKYSKDHTIGYSNNYMNFTL